MQSQVQPMQTATAPLQHPHQHQHPSHQPQHQQNQQHNMHSQYQSQAADFAAAFAASQQHQFYHQHQIASSAALASLNLNLSNLHQNHHHAQHRLASSFPSLAQNQIPQQQAFDPQAQQSQQAPPMQQASHHHDHHPHTLNQSQVQQQQQQQAAVELKAQLELQQQQQQEAAVKMLMMLPFEAPTIFERIHKSLFKMPRVVKDQKAKFENDELFRQLSHECAVKFTGDWSRSKEERQMKFIAGCHMGEIDISVIQNGNQFRLMFNPSEACDFDKEVGKVHLKASFILNGVCVLWRGWIEIATLEGFGCLEFDSYNGFIEDTLVKQQFANSVASAAVNPNPLQQLAPHGGLNPLHCQPMQANAAAMAAAAAAAEVLMASAGPQVAPQTNTLPIVTSTATATTTPPTTTTIASKASNTKSVARANARVFK